MISIINKQKFQLLNSIQKLQVEEREILNIHSQGCNVKLNKNTNQGYGLKICRIYELS